MARMIPPYVSSEIKSSGERLIFDLFKNDPHTENWVVLHSLCLARHAQRLYGEIDFLVLAPNLGIFCLEVKSGDLKREEGVWKFKNKFRETTTTSRGPFQQVQEAMFTIMEAIRNKFGEHSRLNRLIYGYGVMFPHITFQVDGLEYEQWQVYDRDSRRQPISHYIVQLAKNTKNKVERCSWFHEVESLPRKSDVEALLSYLRGDFERLVPPRDWLSDMERQIDQYTSEQCLCLDQLQENPRCLFQGAAGTGKTMIALESVRRGLFYGQKILMVCFNKLLGKWLALQFPEQKHGLTIDSFHSFLAKVTSGMYSSSDHHVDINEYVRFILPLKALEAIDDGTIETFDKLIIDEGQDLIRSEYLDVFDALLKGGLHGGKWEMYCDFERQAIYEKLSAAEMLSMIESRAEFVKFKLTISCRNTRPIGEEASLLSGFETIPFLPAKLEGPPVKYFFYNSQEDEVSKLETIVSDLLKQKIPKNKITILSPRRLDNSCVSKINRGKFTIKELSNNAADLLSSLAPTFSTIHNFKGLENAYVILTDISRIDDEEFKSVLYVGMSRARIGLFVLIDEKARSEYNDLVKRRLGKI